MPAIIQMPGNIKRPPVDLYPRLNFPLYQFVQFPEYVTAPDGWEPQRGDILETCQQPGPQFGKPVIPYRVLVHDEEEKARVLSGGTVASDEVDEKTALVAAAERKGIVVDKRWSIETLRAKVHGSVGGAV